MENFTEANLTVLDSSELTDINGGVSLMTGGCFPYPDILQPTTGPYNPYPEWLEMYV